MITIPAALDAGLFDRAEATLLRMLAADPTNARALARLRRLLANRPAPRQRPVLSRRLPARGHSRGVRRRVRLRAFHRQRLDSLPTCCGDNKRGFFLYSVYRVATETLIGEMRYARQQPVRRHPLLPPGEGRPER